MSFIKNATFIFIAAFFLLTACNSQAQPNNISVNEFEKAIARQDVQVLDVRTAEEYESGHLKDAFLADWNSRTEFEKRVKALDKNKALYVYCLAGSRSKAAADYLQQQGFTTYNLVGGINAWKKASKPLEEAATVTQIKLDEYMAKIPTDKTVLVDFSAVWCPPCKKMTPLLDSLEKTNGHQFVLVKINGGEQTELCNELNVTGFPTFIIYKKGKETWRGEGILEANDFIKQF